ncbi:DUF7835 family putative zinc beta-ribbon protein [Haladaptatus halobius]|jgi:hypothetical protein|uniref:DUF7835 family putative zinc beta-ribbon protein n=1 Tax=Haladaptatus halobius TaxID=2884875 RepID=UPI001D0B4080|nr:hypothetical protein [Haladaptatus halobius]
MTSPQAEGVVEHCENCSRETTHRVSIEIRTENERANTSAFSREPYRVSTCVTCGERISQRMNDA